jgi:hypothetical protein
MKAHFVKIRMFIVSGVFNTATEGELITIS